MLYFFFLFFKIYLWPVACVLFRNCYKITWNKGKRMKSSPIIMYSRARSSGFVAEFSGLDMVVPRLKLKCLSSINFRRFLFRIIWISNWFNKFQEDLHKNSHKTFVAAETRFAYKRAVNTKKNILSLVFYDLLKSF